MCSRFVDKFNVLNKRWHAGALEVIFYHVCAYFKSVDCDFFVRVLMVQTWVRSFDVKLYFHTKGVPLSSKNTAPNPYEDVSDAPNQVVGFVKNYWRCVGLSHVVLIDYSHNCSTSIICCVMRMRFLCFGVASFNIENNPRTPCIPVEILRSVTKSRYHILIFEH